MEIFLFEMLILSIGKTGQTSMEQNQIINGTCCKTKTENIRLSGILNNFVSKSYTF